MEKEDVTQQQQNNDDLEEGLDEATKKLSKAQRKKLKEKNKKAAEKEKVAQIAIQNAQQKTQSSQQVKAQTKAEQKKQEPKKDEPQPPKEAKKDKNKKASKPSNPAALLAKKKLEEQQKFEQQRQRKIKEYEMEQERLRKEEQQRLRKQQEQKERLRKEEEQRIKLEKRKGLHMSKKQKEKMERVRQQLEAQKNAPVKTEVKVQNAIKTEEQLKIEKQKAEKLKKKEQNSVLRDDRIYFERKQGEFRSIVCAILGHVDTGKTTLLDNIRRTNVQEGEAGGITQQIGATFFPQEKLVEEVSKCKEFLNINVNVPGLLIIDTPGHESFSNLRSRGSSLCDIAILVIDLMHGLEKQTLESLELLKKGNTPFVVALNKIDRCYSWVSKKDSPSFLALKNQTSQAKHDFDTKYKKVIAELNVKGYNADMYWNVEDIDDYIPLVPTSGITGEGVPDILSLLVKYATTIPRISKRIKVKKDKFACTVMEVKMIEGYGTTIDCLLVDGKIKKQDQIVLLGFKGPIVTKVKAILTPHPMKEMRIKDEYLHHNEIYAANGVKLSATGLDEAVAGTPLFVCNNEEEVQDAISICEAEFENIKKKIKLQNLGVGVAASTLGSLEALLDYLGSQKVPVSYITVGPVSKDDVMKAMKSVLSEVPEKRKKEYCCLLVFDVKVLQDAQQYAEQNSVKIFTADIIYHLMDMFTKYVGQIREERKQKEGKDAVFPCVLKQVATFRKNDPIVLGVDVEHGVLKVGTPITVYKKKNKGDKEKVRIGFVQSIEHNHKKLKEARKETGSVAICIVGDPKIASGKDFEQKDQLVSMLSRRSIDCLKEHFRAEVKNSEWELIVELKPYFGL